MLRILYRISKYLFILGIIGSIVTALFDLPSEVAMIFPAMLTFGFPAKKQTLHPITATDRTFWPRQTARL
ncbi:MAG: hypothetical protein FWB97_06700 [Oscillospiraceae bacterium]|nr:hypothetical protein [Oscillospiraceae bacterium]